MGLERYVVDAVVLEGRSPTEIAQLLDDPQCLTGSTGQRHDAVDERLDRRGLVRDALSQGLLAIWSEHDDPCSYRPGSIPTIRLSVIPTLLRAVGPEVSPTRQAAART